MVLQSHIKENHFEAEELLTTEDVSNSLEELPEQPAIDTNLENVKCEICGQEEISQAELNKHMELHGIKCDECDSTFTKTDLLDKYQREKHSITVEQVETHPIEQEVNVEPQEEMTHIPGDQGRPQANQQVNALLSENIKLKKENNFLKNRFEQAQTSHNELEKELDEVKKQYEVELVNTRSQFEKMKGELEHLRENNDLLKKVKL
jgi:hypothetical protein